LAEQHKEVEAEIIKRQAVINCKRAILLDAIYEKEHLELDPEELNQYLEKQATSVGKSKDELVSLLSNTNQMDAFLGTLRTSKTLEFITDKNLEGEKDGRNEEQTSNNGI
jgi:FKBP-type peptidyl-prolyl cis-trans isomerase (trigger factor)